MNEREQNALVQSRLLKMFLLGVVGVSFVGFFVGTRYEEQVQPIELSQKLVERQPIGQEPNTWQLEVADGVVGDSDEVALAPILPRTIESRRKNRAYSGAPPTIPHAVN